MLKHMFYILDQEYLFPSKGQHWALLTPNTAQARRYCQLWIGRISSFKHRLARETETEQMDP